jgi:hypothetical protein
MLCFMFHNAKQQHRNTVCFNGLKLSTLAIHGQWTLQYRLKLINLYEKDTESNNRDRTIIVIVPEKVIAHNHNNWFCGDFTTCWYKYEPQLATESVARGRGTQQSWLQVRVMKTKLPFHCRIHETSGFHAGPKHCGPHVTDFAPPSYGTGCRRFGGTCLPPSSELLREQLNILWHVKSGVALL